MLFNRSTPIYTDIKPELDAFRHVIVSNCFKLNSINKYLKIFDDQEKLVILKHQDTNESRDLCYNKHNNIHLHKTVESLLEDVGKIFYESRMGDFYYIHGDESFIWNIIDTARKHGIEDESIVLSKCGSKKNVYCSHCHAINIYDDCNFINCTSCGSSLLVRKHFSRAHGAYLGVSCT